MTTGTKEWSDRTVNICLGCEHNCRYCYAREMAVRYGRCTVADWPKMKVNQKAVDKSYGNSCSKTEWNTPLIRDIQFPPTVMFPSSHDITHSILSECLCVLNKLLDAGNHVLIVSKPHWQCISLMCETLTKYRKQIEFRFTIGSVDDEVLKFWEPGAPNLCMRHACLMYAKQTGYKTSVSCEPYLSDPREVYDKVIGDVTETFWVGKLNQFEKRVKLDGVSIEEIRRFVEPLQLNITDGAVRAIYDSMKDLPKVRFKDSIREVVEN